MAYTHLTPEERHYIETRHMLKDSTLIIACALGRSQSTISRELRRVIAASVAIGTRKRIARPSNAMRKRPKPSS